MRMLEKEGTRSYGHIGSQQFNCDQRKQEGKRKEEETFNFSNKEKGNKGGNWMCKRLDLPKFNGKDPVGWLMKAKECFTIYQLSKKEKKEAAVVVLEGDGKTYKNPSKIGKN